MTCIYWYSDTKRGTLPDGRKVHGCRLHEECVSDGQSSDVAVCGRCENKLVGDDPNLAKRFVDCLQVVDRNRNPTKSLRGLLAGRPAFLAGGGISANDLHLEGLNERGCWSMAVNNMAGHSRFRPQAFVCADPPKKFHHGIWLDPAVMKFVPTRKLGRGRGQLRRKRPDGEFEPLIVVDGQRLSACDCPNVWGFGSRTWLRLDDSFFLEDLASWGNHGMRGRQTGEPQIVCTMLLGLRLLYYLGARMIFLLGVDFRMNPGRENYAFGEDRNIDEVRANNEHFAAVNRWLCGMQDGGIFYKFGLKVYNCNRHSGLRAFPYVPFELALREARSGIPEGPFDLRGWY